MSQLRFEVVGTPGAQGSKVKTRYGAMRESSPKVAPWRQDVVAAAIEATGSDWKPYIGPLRVTIVFWFRRPKGHYGTGKNAAHVKESAPRHPTSRQVGDVDKLARSTCDALTLAEVFGDDSQVTTLHATKRYCHNGQKPGAAISITPDELP